MKWNRVPRNLWVTTIASFLTDISSEMIVYLLPIFLVGVLHTPTTIVGLIEGVAETLTSLSKLAAGYLSDRLGSRKGLVVAGYALSTIMKAFLAVAQVWTVVFAARLGDRLGKGIRTAPRDALIADSVAAEQRGAAFGFHRAGDTLGAFVGIGLAMLIVYLSQQEATLLTHTTFTRLVLFSMIPAGLAVLVLIFGLRESRQPTSLPAQTPAPSLSLRHFDRPFRGFLLIVVIFTLGNSADSFIVLLARQQGASILTILAMVLTFNLVYTLGAQPFGHLSDRIGRRRLIIMGWLVYGLVYLGFALATTLWAVWLTWAFYGFYYALTEGAVKAFVADLVPVAQRGTAYGWYNAAVGLAALPASLLAGLLWQSFGSQAAFLFGAVMAVTAMVGLLWLRSAADAQAAARS